MLWISPWCVLGAAIFSVFFFFNIYIFFFVRTRPSASMRPPCLIYPLFASNLGHEASILWPVFVIRKIVLCKVEKTMEVWVAVPRLYRSQHQVSFFFIFILGAIQVAHIIPLVRVYTFKAKQRRGRQTCARWDRSELNCCGIIHTTRNLGQSGSSWICHHV